MVKTPYALIPAAVGATFGVAAALGYLLLAAPGPTPHPDAACDATLVRQIRDLEDENYVLGSLLDHYQTQGAPSQIPSDLPTRAEFEALVSEWKTFRAGQGRQAPSPGLADAVMRVDRNIRATAQTWSERLGLDFIQGEHLKQLLLERATAERQWKLDWVAGDEPATLLQNRERLMQEFQAELVDLLSPEQLRGLYAAEAASGKVLEKPHLVEAFETLPFGLGSLFHVGHSLRREPASDFQTPRSFERSLMLWGLLELAPSLRSTLMELIEGLPTIQD